MSQKKIEDEELLPPWLMSIGRILGPLALLVGVWWLTGVLNLPRLVVLPLILGLTFAAVVYLGGRYYKPFRIEKNTGRCIAKNAKERLACRHFMPGARLGGGCGRLREDRGCRYVKR